MKEWILENTSVTEDEYDALINGDTINMVDDDPGVKAGVVERTKLTPRKLGEHPMLMIDEFTLKKTNILRKYLYDMKGKNGKYSYKGIKFFVLADMLKDMADILYSKKRNGSCFDLSSLICMEYTDTNIVTAMCIAPDYKEDFYFLHTFVVFAKNGKEYVIDATCNIVMEKSIYLDLFKAKIISSISRDEYYNICGDIENFGLGNVITLAEYFCFPTEVTIGVKNFGRKLVRKDT